jgi:hypothetical protein
LKNRQRSSTGSNDPNFVNPRKPLRRRQTAVGA